MRTLDQFQGRTTSPAVAVLFVFMAWATSSAPAQYFGDLYGDAAEERSVSFGGGISAHRPRPWHPHRHEPAPAYGRGPRSEFLFYVQDRILDFTDFLRLKIGFGGIGFNARATTLVQVGAVYTDGVYAGFERRAVGVWREERYAGGLGPFYQTDIITTYYAGNEFADPLSPWNEVNPRRGYVRNDVGWDDLRWRFLSVGAEVHLGVGVDVAVYVDEVFDFLFGFFMIDFLEDDLSTVEDDRAAAAAASGYEEDYH